MDKYIVNRVLEEASYMLEHKSTVRDIANIYKVSKSTVHKDLQDRLREINVKLHCEVDKIFKEHIEVRHIRGGESTKQKYLRI
ncbi:MAG: sporulation transcriptional regulator SpoIIID [Bacilli bacterium]|nr:sporulation transcriptional regulator SpoIIID [Bacilli bacterium]